MTIEELTQKEANALVKMEKQAADALIRDYPEPGGKLVAPLVSVDGGEEFLLDVTRSRIALKVSHQTRWHTTVILVRLDLVGAGHRNPDGGEIPAPHIHLYREGYDDRWAYDIPSGRFQDLEDPFQTLQDFMAYCNVSHPPTIRPRLV